MRYMDFLFKDSAQVADSLYELLQRKEYIGDLMIIGGDPEPVNTDPETGVFHRIQEMKGHRLTIAVRMLHSLKNMFKEFLRGRW